MSETAVPHQPPGAEQTFFRDPAIDRLLGVVFSLAAEVQVLRDHVAITDLLLERHGILSRGARAAFRPAPDDDAVLAADSAAFVAGILDPLLGRQASRSQGGPADAH